MRKMIYRKFLLSILIITIGFIGLLGNASATLLQAGDIFLFTVNAGNEDDIQLATRINIQSGTTVYLTDNAWNENSGSRVNTEGFMSLTAINNIPAGSVFTLISTGTNHTPTIISPIGGFNLEKISGTFALNNDGDTILVYQSTQYNSLPPTFIYGWGFSSSNISSMPWEDTSNPTTANTSHIPSTLSGQVIFEINGHEGLPANDRKRNRKYNCFNTTINSSTFLHDLKNPANRSGEKIGNKFDVSSPGCSFSRNFDAPILLIDLGSRQADFTSGTLVKFKLESTEPLDINTFTCDDVLLTGDYSSAVCTTINEVYPFDKTIFDVSVQVNLLPEGYGDIFMNILEGSVSSIEGVIDEGNIVDNNYILIDAQGPSITLTGSGSITLEAGTAWVDPGASCTDNLDSLCIVTVNGSVNNIIPGMYSIEYSATDEVGNRSTEYRTVLIIDTTSPSISLNGGGGYTLERDLCPSGDKSPNYHDGVCEKQKKVNQTIFNSSIENVCYSPRDVETMDQGNNISQEFKIAHQMLYSYGLTKWKGTQDYRPNFYITRQEAAKFMVQFAQNVLCREKTRTYNDNFSDLAMSDVTLTNFIREAYEYNIFNGDKSNTFRPTDLISTDELSAIMVRLVTNAFLEEPKDEWAREYKKMLTLYSKNSSLHNAQRDSVAEVIYDLYRNNNYILQNIGYTIE